MQAAPADELICAALRQETLPWPQGGSTDPGVQVAQLARYHGVTALLRGNPACAHWPDSVHHALHEHAVQLAMWELRHQQVVSEALRSLAREAIHPVVIKGTALAYSLYPDPALRARGDTDLIVPPRSMSEVHRILTSNHLRRANALSGEFISYQASYIASTPGGAQHALDVHWKISNGELLSRLFTYDELLRQAQPTPALCSQALAAGPVHSLILACVHRASHKQIPYYMDGQAHYEGNRLIWLYDIHLLAAAFSPTDWAEFIELAHQKGLRAVCLDGMLAARSCLHTEYPASVIASLSRQGETEPIAVYLEGSKLQRQWMDFCALGSMAQRMRYTWEVLFPPADYMRNKYPRDKSSWLPALYLRRAAGGMRKLFLGHRTAR